MESEDVIGQSAADLSVEIGEEGGAVKKGTWVGRERVQGEVVDGAEEDVGC